MTTVALQRAGALALDAVNRFQTALGGPRARDRCRPYAGSPRACTSAVSNAERLLQLAHHLVHPLRLGGPLRITNPDERDRIRSMTEHAATLEPLADSGRWRYVCSCGTVGPSRAQRIEAESDANEHRRLASSADAGENLGE